MHTKDASQPRVSAIIPAFNEEKTVAQVIRSLEGHPWIDEVIVVDDGSTDATASAVRTTSARLISLPCNKGKATALNHGVAAARNEIIFFLDADIRGLSRESIDHLIDPVASGQNGMFVAIRDRNLLILNRLLRFTPILGGERVLTKRLWYHIPERCKKNFQIEIALNYFAKRLGYGLDFSVVPGLHHLKKEKKHGLVIGFLQRIRMGIDLLVVSFRIYALLPLGFYRDWPRRKQAKVEPATISSPPSKRG